MRNTKSVVLLFLISVSALFVNPAKALMNWQTPPRPSNVPTEFDQAVMNLTNWLLGFISLVAVLVVIWGGVQYLTSAGNEDMAKTGKETIKYGLMGIMIAGLAYALIATIVTVIF